MLEGMKHSLLLSVGARLFKGEEFENQSPALLWVFVIRILQTGKSLSMI